MCGNARKIIKRQRGKHTIPNVKKVIKTSREADICVHIIREIYTLKGAKCCGDLKSKLRTSNNINANNYVNNSPTNNNHYL